MLALAYTRGKALATSHFHELPRHLAAKGTPKPAPSPAASCLEGSVPAPSPLTAQWAGRNAL